MKETCRSPVCASAYFGCVRVCVCTLPGHGWGLQSWYSTGDPLQALGELLLSMLVQVRLRER